MVVTNKLEYLIGSKVSEPISIEKEQNGNIRPRATIYGFMPINQSEREDVYFPTYKEYAEFKQTHYFTDRYYHKIEYYGNLFGCSDVMKITTGFFEKKSQIYTPTLDFLGFYDITTDSYGKVINFHNNPDIGIHIDKVFEALKKIGITRETSYQNKAQLVKKLQETDQKKAI